MPRFLKLVAVSVFGLLSAPPALADQWTLNYGGASLGAARTDVDWVDKNGGWYTFRPNTKYSEHEDGATLGIHGGQWFERPNQIVFGWDASFNWFNHETKETSPLYPGSDTWETSFKRSFSLVARVGRASGKWLPYVEAGASVADIGFRNTDAFCASPCRMDEGGWHPGYVLGLGVDYRVHEDVLIGLNYRYADYQEKTYENSSDTPVVEKYRLGAKSQVISLRVSYLF